MGATSNGSRSGDIVLLMNTNEGVIAVNQADILPGWHGAATKTESEVPMIWRFGPADGPDAAHRSDLIKIVTNEVSNAKVNDSTSGGKLRSRHFKEALVKVLQAVQSKTFGN